MMMSEKHSLSILFILMVNNNYLYKCEGRDSLHSSNPLTDHYSCSTDGSLISAGNKFELCFFTPVDNHETYSRYVGIWYYESSPRTVVWVANTDDPVSYGSTFGIAENGNVELRSSNGSSVWTTSLESASPVNRTLQLLDTGNLILVEGESRLWQSFEDPTDTFLPGMNLTDDVKLTSWTSQSDPRAGSYTFQQDQAGFTILNGSSIHWKSGAVGSTAALIDGKLLLPVTQLLQNSINPASQPSTNGGKKPTVNYKNFTDQRIESRLVMSYTGEIQYFHSVNDTVPSWSEPKNRCSIYGICGNSAFCNAKTDPICQCPEGFKPASSEDWKAGQYSAGCDREFAECNNKDSFMRLSPIEVPDEVVEFELAKDEEACKGECLSRCKCKAYSFVVVNGGARSRAGSNSTGKCLVWNNELVNLHHDDYGSVLNIFIRRPREDVGMVKQGGDQPKAPQNRSKKTYVIAGVVVVGGIVLIAFLSCLLYRKIRRPHGYGNQEGSSNTRDAPILFSNQSERRVNELMQERDKLIDVPFYNLDTILSATDNFSDSNKLGQGGFGPVYKGRFPGGHEFAVKRLSSLSGQGIEEFLNEVVLIAKLQHRNLVRLVGYCIKENEKILLYEYMPNRSLDAFIFDQHKCLLLDWKKRFDIILGIARGLLYLHQDSRLRIIHRDLKTSNILLDEDMNPKISDFGLARIVQGKGMEGSTKRVVGTYGYMSPEYALDGKFSTKSDVFSFGVVMLEIVSGKKTNGFYNPHQVLNLLGYTWRLWSEQKALDLVDPTMVESCDQSQVMKCINVGLLCVQEDPNERPSMSSVVVMLGSETTSLPAPTQPAFVVRRRLSTTSSSSSTKPDLISKNDLTNSMVQGR